MKRHVAAGFCIVVTAELLALFAPDRGFILWISGTAMALVIFSIRRFVTQDVGSEPAEPNTDASASRCAAGYREPRRYFTGRNPPDRTGTAICVRCWRDGSKWQPANDAPKIRQRSTPPAECFSARKCGAGSIRKTSARQTGGREPGPGRAALEEILQRLEQV